MVLSSLAAKPHSSAPAILSKLVAFKGREIWAMMCTSMPIRLSRLSEAPVSRTPTASCPETINISLVHLKSVAPSCLILQAAKLDLQPGANAQPMVRETLCGLCCICVVATAWWRQTRYEAGRAGAMCGPCRAMSGIAV